MREYTAKEMKLLQANPYTFKITKHKLYFTTKFKEDFWSSYEAGNAPRKILKDFGYDLALFHQKQIDNIVQRLKRDVAAGRGFREGECHDIRPQSVQAESSSIPPERMWAELKYLRQEVEFLKKIVKTGNVKKRPSA